MSTETATPEAIGIRPQPPSVALSRFWNTAKRCHGTRSGSIEATDDFLSPPRVAAIPPAAQANDFPVLWAQRSSSSDAAKNFVYLTISVPDVPKEDIKLDLKPTSLSFTGTSGTLKRKYHVVLDFFAEIDPAESKINHTAKNVEMKLQKKELKEEYWPRLLKDSKRLHFLKTDFDKWVDEDEQNEAPEEDFSQFGGMGGMPGMGGDFGGIDFSKLAGGGGEMPDLGDEDAEDVDSGDDEDDVEEIPTTKA